MSVVISDTSPINYLILIGEDRLLPHFFDKIYIPTQVLSELNSVGAPEKVIDWTKNLPEWVIVQNPQKILDFDLDKGESAAISLGIELNIKDFITDDMRAREIAKIEGFKVAGTLMLIELAATQNLLDFDKTIEKLCATNFRISESLINLSRARIRARKE